MEYVGEKWMLNAIVKPGKSGSWGGGGVGGWIMQEATTSLEFIVNEWVTS